jgi:hypothetical protein
MSDGLRTRIAAVVADVMNGTPDKPERWDFLLADAIINELGLRKETLNREMWAAAPNVRRYITEWETDEADG